MFGFLKKKLQEAVSKFTKGAKEEIVEEKVDDQELITEAKREEKIILPVKRVHVLPELPAEKEVHEREEREAPAKAVSEKISRIPVLAVEPKRSPQLSKAATKSEPAPVIQKPSAKTLQKTVSEKPKPIPILPKTIALAKPEPVAKSLPRKSVKPSEVVITYFVHGTTTDNEQHLSSGQGDVDLSLLGEEQSYNLANQLKNEFDVIYTSDLTRAVHSAKLTWPDREFTQDARLRECDYGDLTQRPEGELNAYAEKHDIVTEGYPDGESYLDVERRIRDLLNDIYRGHKGEHIAIVAHKATQYAIEVLTQGKSWNEAMADDWRPKKKWQPGWEYLLKGPLHEPKQKIVLEKETKTAPAAEAQKSQGFLKSIFGKKPEGKLEKPAPRPVLATAKLKPIAKPESKSVEQKPVVAVEEVSVEQPVSEELAIIPAAISPLVKRKELEIEEEIEEVPKGFFGKLKEAFTKKTLSEEKFETLFEDFEMALLENNVALEVIDKLKDDLRKALTAGKVSRLGVEDLVLLSLRQSVEEVLSIPGFDLVDRIKKSGKRPYIITFIGVNGSGKTTTLAKVANLFQVEGLSVVMAASDTFRAAAIDQLKEHADKLGIKLISQGYGADPAAVAFDAVEHAKAKNIDVVMIDTAGRLHSNINLMAELQKVVRVAKPDMKIFIGESITGNDCVEQAKEFDRLVGIDAIILSKADVDEKGGAALSVSYVTKKPILYLGVGQAYGDLKEFNKDEIVRGLGL